MKSQIFIGSSSEGLKYVDTIKNYLEPAGDCVLWTTSFRQNRSALDSLVKKTKLTDFAVLIATCDDLTLKRDEVIGTPRDNIVFEFGLFVGATGIDRAFLLAEEEAELPSDLEGIVIARFSKDDTKYNSIEKVCLNLVNEIREVEKSSQLGLLPSTALALGYYHSFIRGVCEQIRDTPTIKTDSEQYKIKKSELHVIIPTELDENGVMDFKQLYNKTHSLEAARTVITSKTNRDYPFHFKIDPVDQVTSEDIEVKIFDIPTTLNTILESIKLFMPVERIGENKDIQYLERRELENFAKVLRYLISKNALTRTSVYVSENVML